MEPETSIIAITAARDTPQGPRRDARFEVDAVACFQTAIATGAARHRCNILAASTDEVFRKQGFEAARAGGEIVVQGEIPVAIDSGIMSPQDAVTVSLADIGD